MRLILNTAGKVKLSGPIDICLKPGPSGAPIPNPFANEGDCAAIDNPCSKVLIDGLPTVTKASKISITTKDEQGVNGGVASGTIMGCVEFILGSQVVKFEGNSAILEGNLCKQNKGNSLGSVVKAGQKNISADLI